MTSRNSSWLLYILECGDKSFYTGITNDLDRRIKAHQEGVASRYTRSRLPVRLIHSEPCRNRSHALKREWELKALTRREKEKFIKKVF